MDLCAQICKRCAEECKKMKVDHCQECAAVCNRCSESSSMYRANSVRDKFRGF